MTLFSRVTEICRERLPSIRVARITIDSIYDLDRMLQPGIRFGVTVRNTSELIGTPIAQIEFFYFSVDVMDGDERMIIQRMETWRNGTYKAFYRIFYDEVCQTRLDGLDGVELGWRDAYDVFQLNSLWEKKAGVYNLDYERPLPSGFYTLQTAVAAIPVSVKKQGLIIVFQSNHRVSDTYQFYGLLSEFDNLERWEKLIDDYDLQDARDYYNLTRNRPITNQEGDSLYYTMDYDPQQTELFAPAAVPSVLRKKGFILTFSPRYEEWESWQFVSSEISDFEDASYWVRKDVTKQLIESLLTGEIKSHRHPSSNYVLDSSSSKYGYYVMQQDAPMQASKSVPAENRFKHLTISFQTLTAWESWQFIGDDIETQWNNVDYWLKIPVGPSLALGEELGTAYEGSKGKANADAIASIASKLEGIQDNAEVNQNAFSRIKVGSSTIASTDKTDTFELVGGSNITLSSSGKKITISSSYEDTTHDDLYANKAGDSNQDFSTKNLNVAGYIQVGSARIVYVPEDPDTGTPGYIKIQHADGSTAMHLVTTGGQTLYSTGVPAAIEEHLCNVYRLLYFGGEPPMEDVITGEQYYDTVEDKIHTAINTEVGGEFLVWDIGGVAPKDNTLYVSESDYIYNTCRLWLYKEGYMRSLGIVQPQMDNAIFLSKNDEVMVTYNTSEEKADIIIGDRVKNRFMVIVPSTTSGAIVVNMIFNSIVPFGFLAEYEIYLYIESENVTNTLLSTECPLEPSETYSSGLILGTLQSTDIIGKGLHKLTYIRDRAAADTHMGLYVKHEYFEKL